MTPNFSAEELTCKCGCGMLPDAAFMAKVQRLRDEFDAPLAVSSAARCPDYNYSVSRTGRSGPHTTGRAIDLTVSHADAYNIIRIAMLLGMFTGIGIQQKNGARFIHLDDLPNKQGQPRPTIWSY